MVILRSLTHTHTQSLKLQHGQTLTKGEKKEKRRLKKNFNFFSSFFYHLWHFFCNVDIFLCVWGHTKAAGRRRQLYKIPYARRLCFTGERERKRPPVSHSCCRRRATTSYLRKEGKRGKQRNKTFAFIRIMCVYNIIRTTNIMHKCTYERQNILIDTHTHVSFSLYTQILLVLKSWADDDDDDDKTEWLTDGRTNGKTDSNGKGNGRCERKWWCMYGTQ